MRRDHRAHRPRRRRLGWLGDLAETLVELVTGWWR
ncbi:hypothetical protein HNR21_004877 [Actinomadura cellulosilytica]|uniref:Uncharacterized protein n=1 Tax=Thermomonospora cellulosilytica TaxID=1411118 RepID=A0A7W3N1T2_9ACTN|nr:hypothetical protein [Thermomonospora cellulosilytica]